MIERERLFRDVYKRRGCCWWKARPLATARERLLVSRPATGGGSAVRAADYTSSSHSFCAPKESQAQQHFRRGRSESIIAQHFLKESTKCLFVFFSTSLSFRALPPARCYYYNECFFPDDDLLFFCF